ncbi:substrate-binding periplasmic protein [Psychromonas aquimarina]|uniref:substrate-binding periplasmic protein n=1 Tax=Psychromonas aquimarina TaxID=444919 RepID=UPI00146FBFA9|nr:transporter substrate-binding domain-containing protein [Psychromonas aquimarina]
MRRIVFLLLLMLLAVTADAKAFIKVASGEWPPFSGKNLKHGGFCGHVTTEAFKLAGYQTQIKYYPWKRALSVTANADSDVSLCWIKSAEREKSFIFSAPMMTQKKVFFYKNDLVFDWSSIADLKGYSIGIVNGYSYGQVFDQAIKDKTLYTETVTSDHQNVKKLMLDRVDLIMVEMVVGYTILNESFAPSKAQMITNHPNPIYESDYHLMISRKLAQSERQRIQADFNKGLKMLKDSGRYQEMFDSMLLGGYDSEQ